MDIKIEPIKIKIKDNKKYCEIAYLVDRKSFLETIYSVRNLFRIRLPIPPRTEQFKSWLNHLTNDTPNNEEIALIRKWFRNISPPSEKLFLAFINGYKGKKLTFSKVFFLIKSLIKRRFALTHNYLNVIENAIVFNRVSDKTYSSVFCYIFNPLWLNPIFQKRLSKKIKNNLPTEAGLMLFFTPQANKTELKKAIDLYYDQLIKDYHQHFRIPKKNIETISNIKRDRRWYWLYENGLSYYQIAQKDEQKEKTDPLHLKETIRQAIRQYRKRLSF
jgi:hypothetical protein